MAGKHKQGKTYPDLRYMFIRGLLSYERFQRSRHYLKSAAEWTSKAIVSLELAETPVKSVKQAKQLEGIGGEVGKKLQEFVTTKLYCNDKPTGCFLSAGPALLVALLQATEELQSQTSGDESDTDGAEPPVLVPEKKVKLYAQQLCQEQFVFPQEEDQREDDDHVSTKPSRHPVFCQSMWRMNVLIGRGLVRKRQLAKKPVYQLLPAGVAIATRLREIVGLDGISKSSNVHALVPSRVTGKTGCMNQTDRALYTNDTGVIGLILLVDTQEWGGERRGLGELSRLFDQSGIQYQTRRLPCGDYKWVWRSGQSETELPMLVERKRADDLAHSLVDKRYERQKEKMLSWKQDFRDGGPEAVVKYIVEGEAALYVVQCADGCGGVGKCGYPTIEKIQETIDELDVDPNFDLLKTEDIHATVHVLTAIHTELQQRISNGDFDTLLAQNISLINSPSDFEPRASEVEHHSHIPQERPFTFVKDGQTKRKRKSTNLTCDKGNFKKRINSGSGEHDTVGPVYSLGGELDVPRKRKLARKQHPYRKQVDKASDRSANAHKGQNSQKGRNVKKRHVSSFLPCSSLHDDLRDMPATSSAVSQLKQNERPLLCFPAGLSYVELDGREASHGGVTSSEMYISGSSRCINDSKGHQQDLHTATFHSQYGDMDSGTSTDTSQGLRIGDTNLKKLGHSNAETSRSVVADREPACSRLGEGPSNGETSRSVLEDREPACCLLGEGHSNAETSRSMMEDRGPACSRLAEGKGSGLGETVSSISRESLISGKARRVSSPCGKDLNIVSCRSDPAHLKETGNKHLNSPVRTKLSFTPKPEYTTCTSKVETKMPSKSLGRVYLMKRKSRSRSLSSKSSQSSSEELEEKHSVTAGQHLGKSMCIAKGDLSENSVGTAPSCYKEKSDDLENFVSRESGSLSLQEECCSIPEVNKNACFTREQKEGMELDSLPDLKMTSSVAAGPMCEFFGMHSNGLSETRHSSSNKERTWKSGPTKEPTSIASPVEVDVTEISSPKDESEDINRNIHVGHGSGFLEQIKASGMDTKDMYRAEVAMVMEVLPHVQRPLVMRKLVELKGNVDSVVSALLEEDLSVEDVVDLTSLSESM